MKRIITYLFAVLMYGFSSHSIAVLPNGLGSSTPGDATEFTQLLNFGQLIAISGALAHQIDLYQNSVKNLLNIGNQQWTEISNDINTVMNAAKSGPSISFAQIDIENEFKEKYPGYRSPTNYEAAYTSWSQSSLDGLKAALQAAGLQAQDFVTEEGVLRQLRSMSETSEGRMQALQVGNQVAVEQVAQTQKLRQLIMAQTQAQSNYLAAERSEKDAQEAEMKGLLEYKERPKINYQYFKGGTE